MIRSQSTEFNSTTVEFATYNYETNRLFITFISGITYRYENVSNEIYEKFMASDSAGRAIHLLLRNNDDITAVKETSEYES